MVTDEPLLQDALVSAHRFTVPLLYGATIVGVLWAGFVSNHRQLESRITRGSGTLRSGATPHRLLGPPKEKAP